jgi:hypothetical protein
LRITFLKKLLNSLHSSEYFLEDLRLGWITRLGSNRSKIAFVVVHRVPKWVGGFFYFPQRIVGNPGDPGTRLAAGFRLLVVGCGIH